MNIATWNVNSIRVRLPQVLNWLHKMSPDVLLLQEIKCQDQDFPTAEFQVLGYHAAIHGQKAYNGVAILSKKPLTHIHKGLPHFSDDQARYLQADVGDVTVASVYVPNGQSIGSDKFAYKLDFLKAFAHHMNTLLRTDTKACVGGDYNIAPYDIDIHDPAAWRGHVLCSPRERSALRAILATGWYDAIRLKHPEGPGPFSWWDYRSGAWSRDDGLRIDHLLISPKLADRVQSAGIDKSVRGWENASDHAPVWIEVR